MTTRIGDVVELAAEIRCVILDGDRLAQALRAGEPGIAQQGDIDAVAEILRREFAARDAELAECLRCNESARNTDPMKACAALADDLARTVNERDAQKNRAARLEAMLREVEWGGTRVHEEGEEWPACPVCGELREDGKHLRGCQLAAVLGVGQ